MDFYSVIISVHLLVSAFSVIPGILASILVSFTEGTHALAFCFAFQLLAFGAFGLLGLIDCLHGFTLTTFTVGLLCLQTKLT
jgi:hypothetical protein